MLSKVVKFNKEYKVTLKGRGYKHCLISNRIHASNRIYFNFSYRHVKIFQECFDEECIQKCKNDSTCKKSEDMSSHVYSTLFKEHVGKKIASQISRKIHFITQ